MVATALSLDDDLGVFDPNRRQGFAGYIAGELGNTKSTAWTYEQNLVRIERWCGMDALKFTVDDVRKFMRLSHYHPSTKNGVLVALKALMRFGLLERIVDVKNAMGILSLKGPKQPRHPKRALSLDQVHKLLDACSTPNEYRAVNTVLYQGLRVSDGAALRPRHVVDDRLIFDSRKGRKRLELPLHAELYRVLDKMFERAPTRDTLKHTWRSLSHYTGIAVSSSRGRTTFAQRLDVLGVQEGVALELMGHEPVTVYRKHYAPVTFEAMAEAMEIHEYTTVVTRTRKGPRPKPGAGYVVRTP